MSQYIDKEQIRRARQIDVLDYVLTHESGNFKRVGSGYRRRDHPSLEVKRGKWRWYSHGLYGKTALDYLTEVQGYKLVDAVCKLLGVQPLERSRKAKSTPHSITPNAKPPPETPSFPFTMPLHNKDDRRVVAYLQSRGIDKQVILNCIARGSLYERATSHDCVFLGRDQRNRIRFAAMRSTTSNVRRDADGSDKKYGFLIPPDNPNSTSVAAFESPIDALSHQTMCKQGFIQPFDGWRISLGGVSTLALEHFLEHHKNVNHCLVCTDNDEAGEKVAVRISEMSNITSERSPPKSGVDWNDALQIAQKAERLSNGKWKIENRKSTELGL